MAVEFKVEKNKKYGDWRVAKYVDGEWYNERDGNWSRSEAERKAEIYRRRHAKGFETMSDRYVESLEVSVRNVVREELSRMSEATGKTWAERDVKDFIFGLSRSVESDSMKLSKNLRNVELSDIPNKRAVHTQLRKADIALGRAFEEIFRALKLMP